MSERPLAIYGVGGFGREVMQSARSRDVVFVSDLPRDRVDQVDSRKVVSFDTLIGRDHRHRDVVIAVGNPAARRRIAVRCEEAGLAFGAVVAETHRSGSGVTCGSGTVLSDFSMITADAIVGRHCHLNIYSYIAHDCIVGDFVTFSPRVCCNGNVVIEDDVYIGTGAVLREGQHGRPLRIGAGAVVGMGAVVTRDVAPGTTVMGVPAKPMASPQ